MHLCEYEVGSLLHEHVLTLVGIAFLSGVPFTVAIIQIPQRYQIVNDASALEAGVRLLPLTLCASVGTVVANMLASTLRIPPVFIILLGTALQILGATLLSTLPTHIIPREYSHEVFLSIGIGLNLGILIPFVPQIIRDKDQGEYY